MAHAQIQGLIATILLVLGLMVYLALQELSQYALRDGYPMSFWEIYLAPLLYLSGAAYHYAMAVSVYRGAEPSLLARVGPVTVCALLAIYRLF
jgi:hypothetical protein